MGLFNNSNKSNEVRPDQVEKLAKLSDRDRRAFVTQTPDPANAALYTAARRNSSDAEIRAASREVSRRATGGEW